MKLEFDSLEELREFIAEIDGDSDGAAKPKRTRKTKAEKEAEAAATPGNPNASIPGPGATVAGQPAAAAQGFTQTGGFAAPGVAAAPQVGFAAPGAASGAVQQTVQLSPVAQAMIEVTEKSLAAGQPVAQAEGWWRNFLGPDAAQATWEQIKTVFIPRVPEANLKAVAPQFGITV